MWNEREKTNGEIIRFAAISAFSYFAAIILFRLFLMKRVDMYVSTDAYPVDMLFSGIISNIKSYMRIVNGDFGIIWKILLIIICLVFIIRTVLSSKRNKIIALVFSFAAVIMMCIMSYGVYLVLERPLFLPRAMYGFGVFVACMGVYLSNIYKKKIALIPTVLLCWCFFVFSFTYGNALSDQKRYNNF
jgi:hypothetical protein